MKWINSLVLYVFMWMCHDLGLKISFYLFIWEPKSMPISTQTLSWVLEKIIDWEWGWWELPLDKITNSISSPLGSRTSKWLTYPTNYIYLLVLINNVHPSPHGVDKTRSTCKKDLLFIKSFSHITEKDRPFIEWSENILWLYKNPVTFEAGMGTFWNSAWCFLFCAGC